MVNKDERVIITGPSGSGKDWLLRELSKSGLKSSTKTTTRPKRTNEVSGVNYHFIDHQKFQSILENGGFICHQKFDVVSQNGIPDTWHYGLSKDEFNSSRVFILTPNEIGQIPKEIRSQCFVVYLDIDRDIRESRILKRNDTNDSVKRRLDSDEIDFKDFKDYDLRITDPDFESSLVLSLMF